MEKGYGYIEVGLLHKTAVLCWRVDHVLCDVYWHKLYRVCSMEERHDSTSMLGCFTNNIHDRYTHIAHVLVVGVGFQKHLSTGRSFHKDVGLFIIPWANLGRNEVFQADCVYVVYSWRGHVKCVDKLLLYSYSMCTIYCVYLYINSHFTKTQTFSFSFLLSSLCVVACLARNCLN